MPREIRTDPIAALREIVDGVADFGDLIGTMDAIVVRLNAVSEDIHFYTRLDGDGDIRLLAIPTVLLPPHDRPGAEETGYGSVAVLASNESQEAPGYPDHRISLGYLNLVGPTFNGDGIIISLRGLEDLEASIASSIARNGHSLERIISISRINRRISTANIEPAADEVPVGAEMIKSKQMAW